MMMWSTALLMPELMLRPEPRPEVMLRFSVAEIESTHTCSTRVQKIALQLYVNRRLNLVARREFPPPLRNLSPVALRTLPLHVSPPPPQP